MEVPEAAAAPIAQQDVASPASATKKATASLLPAFEPLSSSPGLPRVLKRTRDAFEETRVYPTPVPTSSTAILTSSPPRNSSNRPSAQRTLSTLSERAPLASVPSIVLNADGKPIRLGRSSASCDYQLSANRLISRVHVEVTFTPALSRLERDKVQIVCTGWNGVKIHCQSQVYELRKGQSFSSDIRDEEIMLDVHDSRIVLQWPEKLHLGPFSSDEDEEAASPIKKQRAMRRHSTPPSPSPIQSRRRAPSPVSPSPAVRTLLPSSPPVASHQDLAAKVEIYEDPMPPPSETPRGEATQSSQLATQILPQSMRSTSQDDFKTVDATPDFSDHDEENDPIIHSFGPFGANILPRLAAFHAADSPRTSSPLRNAKSAINSPPQSRTIAVDVDIKSHIINQLAFSRLSSTPLSIIFSHLPHGSGVETKDELGDLIRDMACVGEVLRAGKDAAGKALESEYYYVPEQDDDEMRKEAVVHDLRKPGLRACRKQHKQYFWRKPK